MNVRKLAAAVTCLSVLFGTVAAGSVAGAQSSFAFSDVPSSYVYSASVEYLKDEGIVEGYPDGTYMPENTINRAEFVKIALLAIGETPEGSECFPDVRNQWFAPYVCKAKQLGMIHGYPDGTFKPERPIYFVEAGKIVAEGTNLAFDASHTENWFHKYVKALEGKKAIPVSVEFLDQYINRGEMAEMIWRLRTNTLTETTSFYDALREHTRAQYVNTISSCDELKNKFSAQANYYGRDYVMMEQAMPASSETTADSTQQDFDAKAGAGEGFTPDYSDTNVQVQGVDEADIVKTDGKYIYQVVDNTVRIVEAYPPMGLKELDKIKFTDSNFWPRDMYVDGNKLVVLGTAYYSYPYPTVKEDASILPYPYYGGGLTKVYIFDITDKTAIKNFRVLEFEGDLSQSRKVGEMVYVVINRPGFWAYPTIESVDEVMPRFKDSGDTVAQPLCGCTDVKYIPAYESASYLIVAGIPIDTANAEISKEVILGSSENIYASAEHMYVAASDWGYMLDWRPSGEATNFYKFNLERGNVKFLNKGNVPGRILNQFSMDEYDNHFRVATTKGWNWNDTPSTNNVYVLDSDMNMTGKIEGIAPGEDIFSVRFMGKRAYMVTFKKIDPFFVIDVSDHAFPRILGQLKIPGYSDYLHPYDDNHIIGFGKEAVEATEEDVDFWGGDFAWYQGMKVALFDVTDVANPKEKFKIEIGDRGTDSPLLRDHKALLFDKATGMLAFPVTLAEIADKTVEYTGSQYGEIVFQGAYVYHLSLADGFKLWGTISHYDSNEVAEKAGYYWWGNKDIQRVLYIGDYLYTVSRGMVKANRKASGVEEVNEVALEESEYDGGDYWIMPIW